MANRLEALRDATGQLPASADGGYPLFYLDSENSVLCASCATASLADDELPQFRPIDYGINYEGELFCAQCSAIIPAAYTSDEEN